MRGEAVLRCERVTMDFRTTIKPTASNGLMSHSDKLILIGSCVSDHIGGKMRHAMMDVVINPTGTVYNPLSVAATVRRLVTGEAVAGMDLFQQGGVWNSYDFHSRFSLPDKTATLERMNARIAEAHEFLRLADTVILTLGTAVVYRRRDTGAVVANCHKVPQHEFQRSLSTLDELVEALVESVELLRNYNPGLRIIFTVSPIRHVADRLEMNSLSKAMLRVAVGEVERRYGDLVGYFPAYEIMMDDLRDYRFYAADMVHPSEVAIEYIWQTFQGTYFDDRDVQAIARCERVAKRLQHRPMSHSREAVESFQADTRAVVRNLVKEYPHLEHLKEIRDLLDND